MTSLRNLPRILGNALLAVTGVLGTVYCVTSAFELQVQLIPLLLTALIFSLMFSWCFQWKRGLLIIFPLAVIVLFLAIRSGLLTTAGPSLQQLLHDILSRFSRAYPNLSFIIPPEPAFPVSRDYTLLFALLAALLSLWLAWGVGYRSCLITVAGTLPFLLLCVIINDTPPRVFPLILLLSVWVSVLLAKERPQEPASMSATRLALTLMAVLLVLGVIGVVYPKEDTRHQDLPEVLQNILDRLPGPMQNALSREATGFLDQELGADTGEVLDLTTQGTRDRKDTVMMQISSTEPGVMYLRGAAKDIYTGHSWESRNEAGYNDSVYAHTSLGTAFGGSNQAAVEVHNLHDNATVAFTPYGFINCAGAEEISGDLRVPCLQDEYIIYYWPGVGTMDLTQTGLYSQSYDRYVAETCLDLPDGLKETLVDLAVSYGYDPELDTLNTIAWVAEFVRTVGTYRLGVARQPVNYDFAEYFLTESREGYCVHFATASAVMLRALDIPARYASGYRVEVSEAGAVTDVIDQDTHAWAEVYLSGLGWIPIETTPGFGSSASLPEVAHAPQEPAQPDEPEEPEEPSQEPSQEPGSSEETSQEPAAPSPSPSAAPSDIPTEAPMPQGAAASAAQSGGFSWQWLIYLPVLLILAVAALVVRHSVIRRRRTRQFATGSRNLCMIAQWVYLERLTAWGAEIPDGMEALAMKAKFSQHEITLEELVGFTKVVQKLSKETESGLGRWKHLRFKWLACLDLE